MLSRPTVNDPRAKKKAGQCEDRHADSVVEAVEIRRVSVECRCAPVSAPEWIEDAEDVRDRELERSRRRQRVLFDDVVGQASRPC